MKHPFADLIGLVFIEQGGGRSHCQLAVTEALFNPQGFVHGGVLYSLADTGMGGALYPLLQRSEYCATIEIKISYFSPVQSGVLTCESLVVNRGKSIVSLESQIRSEDGLVAKASGTFSVFRPRTAQTQGPSDSPRPSADNRSDE